ncbi:hypothetical protein [Spirillospora sp. NPDC029432]|uniref:type II toxin-antitoxin system ParD family antitoxin n=1 Tax=Spirillospora sp. NPDC029432 TaxID=3154599 RepID=UPI003452CECE
MTKKIGISLPDDLHAWIVGEIEDGRADSVSGLIADALEALRGQDALEQLVSGMEEEIGELGPEERADVDAWMEEAGRAAEEARRRRESRERESSRRPGEAA